MALNTPCAATLNSYTFTFDFIAKQCLQSYLSECGTFALVVGGWIYIWI